MIKNDPVPAIFMGDAADERRLSFSVPDIA